MCSSVPYDIVAMKNLNIHDVTSVSYFLFLAFALPFKMRRNRKMLSILAVKRCEMLG